MANQCGLLFKALSDPTRQKILELLAEREQCVSDIVEHFNMSQPSISHHLDMLKRAGVVNANKRGREVYYSLNRGCICDCCGPFFSRFGIAMNCTTESD